MCIDTLCIGENRKHIDVAANGVIRAMTYFGLLKKHLKRIFRSRKGWLLVGMLFLSVGISFMFSSWNSSAMAVFFAEPNKEGSTAVFLQRVFVCGIELQQMGNFSQQQIVRLKAKHPEWQYSIRPNGEVVFTAIVKDLSNDCKRNAFFGLDATGNLTLFHGPPSEGNAIRTFFQLNIDQLESVMPDQVIDQLHRGIRITDLAEYNSTLSTFSDFAVDETEKVMKRQN